MLLRYLTEQASRAKSEIDRAFKFSMSPLKRDQSENKENRHQRIIALQDLLKFQNNQRDKVADSISKLAYQTVKSTDGSSFVETYQNWNASISKFEDAKRRDSISKFSSPLIC